MVTSIGGLRVWYALPSGFPPLSQSVIVGEDSPRGIKHAHIRGHRGNQPEWNRRG